MQIQTPASFFATCPKNLEGLLEEELLSLGARNTKQTVAGVKFGGNLALAYRACLWSRLANRILLPLAEFGVPDAKALYNGVRRINWTKHLHPDGSLIVDFAGVSQAITNSHFGALKVKDAIVDQIREVSGRRPDVAKENPDLRINVYLYNDTATVSIDLSGESLHRRGYREQTGPAPIKENLAAAILYRSKWPEMAKQNKPLLDPMCGSGTILIEAAMIAQDYAPGLLRETFGFSRWLKHDARTWQTLLDEAHERRQKGTMQFTAEIRGYDSDPKMVAAARRNIENAHLEKTIDVITKEVSKFTPPTHHGNQYGMIVTNPPYGERLYDTPNVEQLYRDFGVNLRERFIGWKMAMLTGNPSLGKALGIRTNKQYSFFNGSIPCKLLLFDIKEDWFMHYDYRKISSPEVLPL